MFEYFKENYELLKKLNIPKTIKEEQIKRKNMEEEDFLFYQNLLRFGLNELYKKEIDSRIAMDKKIAKYMIKNYSLTPNKTIELILLYSDFIIKGQNKNAIRKKCIEETVLIKYLSKYCNQEVFDDFIEVFLKNEIENEL